MFDALQIITEGILKLAAHGGVLVLTLAVMLAIVLLAAWFDGIDNADRIDRRHRGQQPPERAADRELT